LLHSFKLLRLRVAFQLLIVCCRLPSFFTFADSVRSSSTSIPLVQTLQLPAQFRLSLQFRILSAQFHLRFSLRPVSYLCFRNLQWHLNPLFNPCSISSSFGLRLAFVQLPFNLACDFVKYLIDYLPPSLLQVSADLHQSLQILLSIFRNYLKTWLTPYPEILDSIPLTFHFVFQYFNQPKDLAFWTLTCGSYLFSHMLSHILHYQPFGLLVLPGFL